MILCLRTRLRYAIYAALLRHEASAMPMPFVARRMMPCRAAVCLLLCLRRLSYYVLRHYSRLSC